MIPDEVKGARAAFNGTATSDEYPGEDLYEAVMRRVDRFLEREGAQLIPDSVYFQEYFLGEMRVVRVNGMAITRAMPVPGVTMGPPLP